MAVILLPTEKCRLQILPCMHFIIGIFISPIQILVELVEMMQKGLSGFRRFLDVMETESEITDAPDARELTDVKGHVSYEHVFFSLQ